MKTYDYLNKWLFCIDLYYIDKFQEINNLDLVHIEYQNFVKNNRTQTIYKCISIDEQFLLLKSKLFEIKVKPEAVKGILPYSTFYWGDRVQEIERPEIKGEIDNIIWHDKDHEYKYFIKVDNKLKTKRYSFYELKLMK